MKKKTLIFSKEVFSLLLSHFWKFFKRLYVFAFFYSLFSAIPVSIIVLLNLAFVKLGVPHSFSMIVIRILLTVAPIIPTIGYCILEQEDECEEFSMDLCFTAWILIAVYAWKFL